MSQNFTKPTDYFAPIWISTSGAKLKYSETKLESVQYLTEKNATSEIKDL